MYFFHISNEDICMNCNKIAYFLEMIDEVLIDSLDCIHVFLHFISIIIIIIPGNISNYVGHFYGDYSLT